jgi:hypothetical protein
MASVTELLGAAYDALLKSVNAGSNTFLQLAWPGIALSPADFKDPANPAGPYDPGYAEETFSFLSNIAPVFDATHFINSGFEVDDLYQLAISGAVPAGAALDQLLTNPAYRLFSDAQYEFVSARRGSRKDPNVFYYPCQALPSDWYTEASANAWPTFSIGGAAAPPPLGQSQLGQRGGAGLLLKGLWQLKPAADEQALKGRLQQAIQTKAARLTSLLRPIAVTRLRPLEQNFGLATTTLPAGTTVPRPASGRPTAGVVPPAMTRLLASADLKKQLRPDPLVSLTHLAPALVAQTKIDPGRFEIASAKNLAFNKKLILTSLLNELLIPQPVSPASKNFAISFRYAQVTISRPWLKLALLTTGNWYIPGTAASAYATGTTSGNTGMFPLLPTSFIVIRNLKITANWSAEDRANASKAAAFGPFSTVGATFNQDTLEIPGLQVVAWLSRLMPPLPPLKDPLL